MFDAMDEDNESTIGCERVEGFFRDFLKGK